MNNPLAMPVLCARKYSRSPTLSCRGVMAAESLTMAPLLSMTNMEPMCLASTALSKSSWCRDSASIVLNAGALIARKAACSDRS